MKLIPQLSKNQHYYMLAIASLVVLLTLIAGLSPRGSYSENWVTPVNQSLGLNIGKHGFLYGEIPRNNKKTSLDYSLNLSLNIIIREQKDTTFRFLLYLGDGCDNDPLIIGQWRNRLIAMQGCDFPNNFKRVRLNVNIDSIIDELTTITIKSEPNRSEIFFDKTRVAEKKSPIYTPSNTHNSLLILGNSPNGKHGWSGTINSINIVEETRGLSSIRSTIISQHSFVFNRPKERIRFRNSSNLSEEVIKIAKIGWFPQPDVLARSPIESLIKHNKIDIAVNLTGFIPLGICSAAILFINFGFRGLTLVTTTFLLGTFLSLSIELTQTFIVGRRSNLHDVFLNGLGTLVGIAAFSYIVLPLILRKFVEKPFQR